MKGSRFILNIGVTIIFYYVYSIVLFPFVGNETSDSSKAPFHPSS